MGVLGSPVAHSRSPAIHNAALAAAGLDAVYLPLLCPAGALAGLLACPLYAGFAGFSVTLPLKEEALRASDEADDLARRIGAANTLVRLPGGRLRAYNTDCFAAVDSIEARCGPLAGRAVLVLGAGGAARAVAFGAAARGAAVLVANRSAAKAAALAADVGGAAVGWDEVQAGRVAAAVLVNCTSLGMSPDVGSTPAPAATLANYGCVADSVYVPRATRLLREARAAGVPVVVDGCAFFLAQAAAQYRLFNGGADPPPGVMASALDASLGA